MKRKMKRKMKTRMGKSKGYYFSEHGLLRELNLE